MQQKMKRTLMEVACGLAALVVLVSFNNRIAALKGQDDEVRDLKTQVDATLAKAGSKQELAELRKQVLAQLDGRMHELDDRLQTATAGSAAAEKLQTELTKAQREVARLRDELQTDNRRTKAMVDAYMDEVRAKENTANLKLVEARAAISTIAGQLVKDTSELTRAMLLPTVQLNGDDTVGSGTLVFSGTNKVTDKVESYVLTSFHVVRNILTDKPSTQKEGFDVTIYLPDGKVQVKGNMVANNARIDAALVKLQTDRVFPFVANIYPKNGRPVKVWDGVCAVGCPLGNDPVPSQGEISSLQNELNGSNYWMINAPTYFGNSGGGVYLGSSHQLIGVFSKIYTHGRGNPVVVPHMGLCTPIDAIYEWLVQEKLDHLLQSVQVTEPDLQALAAPIK
jgi:S1-C subfamily serine protease